jgi:hypothetical protein
MHVKPLNVYIGVDSQFGELAAAVCEASLRTCSSIPLNVVRLEQAWLKRVGLYKRQFYVAKNQRYDCRDGLPFSSEFSYTRFLVPCLQPSGPALFCDSDFMFMDDVAKLVEVYEQGGKSCWLVKHNYQPKEGTKMLGQVQGPWHARKNWSSLVLWDCASGGACGMTPYQVNNMDGSWLHKFTWMRDDEIGELDEAWNWLDGHSSPEMKPSAVHFTRGTPDMDGWEGTQYARQWWSYARNL